MSEPIKSYRDLIAWQKAFKLGCTIHRFVAAFPETEKFGLVASLRRTATNISADIAQGYGRGNTQDYLWFLKSARGGIYQLDTQLLFALEFRYVLKEGYDEVKAELDEAERVLAGLIRSLGA